MTDPTRRSLLQSLASLPLALQLGNASAEADWPTKPVSIYVGYPPGGLTDVMARGIGKNLSLAIGQPVIVENRPGASSNIAAGAVVRAAPDGYTQLLAPTSMQTANPWLYKTAFSPSRDLMPIAGIANSMLYLLVRPDLKVKDAPALIELAKKSPVRLTYASAGNATPPHLATELLKQNADFDAVHVPYRGSGPAIQDVLANQCDFLLDPGSAFPFIRSGKLRLLGVASNRRSPFFPDVPTLSEQGIPGNFFDIWFGMWAPAETPAGIISRVGKELQKLLKDPGLTESLAGFGVEPSYMEQSAFKKLLTQETELMGNIIRDRKITAG